MTHQPHGPANSPEMIMADGTVPSVTPERASASERRTPGHIAADATASAPPSAAPQRPSTPWRAPLWLSITVGVLAVAMIVVAASFQRRH